jgi:hypothetical protein
MVTFDIASISDIISFLMIILNSISSQVIYLVANMQITGGCQPFGALAG